MGACWGCLRRRSARRRRIVLILIGLDNAGKSQTASYLAGEAPAGQLPTVGFKAVNLIHRDTPVTIYDLGGGPQFRQIWPQYYSEVHGVIFVIDSSDFARLEECKNVLEEVLSHDKISGKPVLILANKQDKRGALDDIDVVEKLNVEPLVNRYRCPTLVESYTAAAPDKPSKKPKLDPGLKKGYLWLLNYIIYRYGDINLRVQTDIHAELERRKRQSEIRASQTFTAESHDEISTGFENPNYVTLTRNSDSERIESLHEGVIIVKPITMYKENTSEENTLTVESLEESESTASEVKRSSERDTVPNSCRVEIEKHSSVMTVEHGNNIDFKLRPQSSPSIKFGATKLVDIAEEKHDKRNNSTHLVIVHDANQVCRADGSLSVKRELVIIDRNETAKVTTSDSGLNVVGGRTLPADGRADVRPASASQLIRKQLEVAGAHRRRLSLRYVQRNKTSPESYGLFHYEPSSEPVPVSPVAKRPERPGSRQMDKGDFVTPPRLNYMTHDATL